MISLSIQSCEHEVSLLRMLAAGENGRCTQLRHLAIIQSPDIQSKSDRDSAIDEFLHSFEGLNTLVISAPKTAALRPELDAVAHHENTICSLYLDCMFARSRQSYDYEDVEEYLAMCEKLEQLALRVPHLHLETDQFLHCGTVNHFVVSTPTKIRFILTNPCTKDALALLPALHTLHIINMPSADDSEDDVPHGDIGFVYVDTCLKALPQHIFDTLNDVRALALGKYPSKMEYIGEVPVGQSFYERGRLLDMDGHAVTAAIEASRSHVRDMAPASNILDLDTDEIFVRYGQDAY